MSNLITKILQTLWLLNATNFVSSSAIPPTALSTKSEICPHGVHYIDSCKNACSCDPRYGGAMCSRMTNCDEFKGACPFGKTFSDPTWGYNFQCQCNKDKSQTYECFDLKLLSNYALVYSHLI